MKKLRKYKETNQTTIILTNRKRKVLFHSFEGKVKANIFYESENFLSFYRFTEK